jgi:hypothetical protein
VRTTVDIDPVVLEQLRARQRQQGRTLGSLVSELLAHALRESSPPDQEEDFVWTTADLGARIDLEDKDAVARALGEDPAP